MITLFINPIGKSIDMLVIDTEKRTVIESLEIQKTGNDFEIIPAIFIDIVKKHIPSEIWCIVGPWPFTLMRIITLIINSIAYNTPHLLLKWCHFFELIPKDNNSPILEANRHEYLIQDTHGKDMLIEKKDLPLWKYIWYIDDDGLHWYTPYKANIHDILRIFQDKWLELRLSPLYIKAPNITLWSKKTSLQHF